MSYCSLADAFPNFEKNTPDSISVGCTDTKSAERAKKEQKKKSKRCKDPSLKYLEPDYVDVDPDRPALIRQPEVLPMNSETGVVEARPFQGTKEGFESCPLPKVPGTKEVFAAKRPKYFGSSGGDEEEGFAPFTTIIGDDPAYRLGPSSAEKEIQQYIDKITGGELLPSPSLDDVWKPLTPAGAPTSFFQQLPPPGGEYPKTELSKSELSKKIDDIFVRLDQLESERKQSSQTEILLFVGSGLFLLASIDLLSR